MLSGCATTSRFTSRAELEKVLAAPKPVQVFKDTPVDVARWDFAGPFPERIGPAPHDTADAWGRLFVERAGLRGVRPVEPLRCAARETARFISVHQTYPGALLKSFLLARCGSSGARVQLHSLSGEAPDEVADDALFTRWKDQVATLADGVPAGHQAGLAFARMQGRAAVVVASQAPTGALEPLPIFPAAGGVVVLRGTAPPKTASIEAYANQGRTKSVQCRDTKRFALPSFELECQVDPNDAHAWLDVTAFEEGRVLGSTFVQVLVWPKGEPTLAWERPVYGTPVGELTPEGVVAKLNEVRQGGGLKPLEFSPAQSADNRELAPFFFDAMVRGDEQQLDRLALGLIAGWRVESEISNGTFSAQWAEAPDLSALVAQALESAGSRARLLDPDHRVGAAGLYREGKVVGLLTSAYARVDAAKWPDSAEAVLLHLDEQRKKLGKPETEWLRLPSQLEKRLTDAVAKRKLDEEEALEAFMREAVEVTNRPVQGWRVHATRLSQVEWPESLLKREKSQVLALVAVQRKRDESWADYVILMVILLNDGGDQT